MAATIRFYISDFEGEGSGMAHKGRIMTVLFCGFLAGLLVWHIALPDRARSETENRTPIFVKKNRFYSTISSVPAAIRAQPTMDLGVNCSFRMTAASTMVMTILSLSIGMTLDASPNCSAL
mgnify:CR=1 FL=1